MSRPIALSDEQLTALMRTAETIPYDRREAFLLSVAELLNGQEIGDGAVARAIRTAAKLHFDPPELGSGSWSKYG
jgi:hypothetical protein